MFSSSSRNNARASVRVGIIGLGQIGAIHYACLREMEGVSVVAIAETNPANRPADLEGVRLGSDYREIIAADDIDAVVISLPHYLHYSVAEEALRSGKDVFLEKPIATVYDEAVALVRCSEEVGRTVMVNMTHRFYPPMHKARELLQSGALGDVVSVRDYYMEVINRAEFPAWFFDPVAAGGGVAVTDSIHLIDRIEWLLGEPLHALSAHGRRMDPEIEVEDSVEFLCSSASGVPITVGSFFCFDGPKTYGDGLTVFGTRGMMTVHAWSHVEWTPYGGETERFEGYLPGLSHSERASVGHKRAIVEFVASLREGRAPASEARVVLNAQKVVQEFYRLYPSELFFHDAPAQAGAPHSVPRAESSGTVGMEPGGKKSILAEAEGLRVINAVGYATRVAGSSPSAVVLDAMHWAQGRYFELDDLFAFASQRIALETESEAGFVTCGAGAALTLGAAAILAGNDVERMERLPDTSDFPRREFLYPAPNYFDYDHAVRASGAVLMPFSFEENDDLEARLAAVVGPRTAGIVFVWKSRHQRGLIERIGAFCRTREIPFLLDAAMGLPPAENLSDFYALGANLVALSGGKHLGGPQNSGLLFGDRDLVLSAWLQMVDMHVQPDTWGLAGLVESGTLARPPRHGIGRGFKVGKDVIFGCLTALAHYSQRDFAAEAARWSEVCSKIAANVCSTPEYSVESLVENATGQYPVIRVTARSVKGMTAFKRGLKARAPKILTAEDDDNGARVYLYPMALSDEDVCEVIQRMNEVINA